MRALREPSPALELWIVTHADLKRTARVRAFFGVVGDGLAAERALLRAAHRPGKRSARDRSVDRNTAAIALLRRCHPNSIAKRVIFAQK